MILKKKQKKKSYTVIHNKHAHKYIRSERGKKGTKKRRILWDMIFRSSEVHLAHWASRN